MRSKAIKAHVDTDFGINLGDSKLHSVLELQSQGSGECGVSLHYHYFSVSFDTEMLYLSGFVV